MTIGALVCHLPSGALFRLSGRVGVWLCGYDVAGAWGQWPASECAATGDEPPAWYGEREGF